MSDVGRCVLDTVICIVLILLAMFFSASQAAVVSFSKSKLKKLSDENNKTAAALYRLKERQFDFTQWSDTASLICMIAASCLGVYAYSPLLEKAIAISSGNAGWSRGLALFLTFIVVCFIVIVFGQALPKKLVSYKPENFAFSAMPMIRALSTVFRPFTGGVLASSRGIVRLFGCDPNRENADITEEEIRMLVDAGNQRGTIEGSEREMINNVFEFGDRTVDEVMTHRTDISAVEQSEPLSEVLQLSLEEGFSRVPIYHEDIDDIVGVIYAKDLLNLIGKADADDKTIQDYMRPLIYMPESTRCDTLFKRFKESKIHMAVIVDEYGGTAGIATMEDLLESIVGNIQDEYDQEVDEIKKLADDYYSLDGGVSIETVEDLFHVDLDADEDTETVGGLIVNTLGRIPGDDEKLSVIIKNIEFTVMVVEERRIVRVNARKLPDEKPEEPKNGSERSGK